MRAPEQSSTIELRDASEIVTNEPTADREIATNEPTVDRENATNEPTVDRENATNEPTAPEQISTTEPTGGAFVGLESPTYVRAPEQNSTIEPTDARGNATNKPTVACENVTNEPTVASENVTNEPTVVRGNVTNEPTDVRENVTNEPTDFHGNATNEPTAPEHNSTNGTTLSAGVGLESPTYTKAPDQNSTNEPTLAALRDGGRGVETTARINDWDDSEEIDRQKAVEWIREELAETAAFRAEKVRQSIEESRKEAKEANAGRLSRRGWHENGKPADRPNERAERAKPRPTETNAARIVGDSAELVNAGSGLTMRAGPAYES
jgi:hypothetical protein